MRIELGKKRAAALAVTLVIGNLAHAANPDRDAYFGETHVHTSWSLDAWLFGNRITDPGDAYKYFKGQPIKHPLGYDIKIDTPLDWAGVTDHSEYVGVIKFANDPNSPVSKLPAAQPLKLNPDKPVAEEMQRIFVYGVKVLMGGPPVKALASPEIAGTVWKETMDLANKANEPGKFTAFCSYEWTSMPNNMNMHRNVFFKDCGKTPQMPFSALDSPFPEDLWIWMDGQRKTGNELLAISHNANVSDGRMFPTEVDFKGRPIDAAYAASRMRNEPLIEMKQLKGTSETHPLLSPNDEFGSFEIMSFLLGDPPGRIPHVVGSYARQALKDGITMQDTKGFNPYKFGFGAAADTHNTGAAYRQDNFFGGHGAADGAIETRMSGRLTAGMDPRVLGTAGLTGVWAEENTRASLFEAMQRKETFAVSGPHIKVRLFGGWEYAADTLNDPAWVKTGYAKGVPMGSDLPPAKGKAPTLVVWAVKDPTSGNLDRIQIVKGWTKNGQSFERIYDVAWAGDRKADKWTGVVPPIGSTVDVENATYANTIGAVELKKVWTDPEFDPSLHAFYYARVLEIPTPRWTTIQAKQIGIAPPDVVPATLQERAWTSPIWYTPAADARKGAKPGVTVAQLKQSGAAALNDAQLKALIVDKSTWLANNVTGDKYQIVYGASGKGAKQALPNEPGYVTQQFADNQGQFWLRFIGRRMALPSAVGNLAEASYLSTTAPYYINNGRIVTSQVGTPIEITVYKSGNKYVAARSNEFGYANYEIIPAVAELNPLGPIGATPRSDAAMIARLLREPLVQFLFVGLALFGAWHFMSPSASAHGAAANRIVLTEDDVRQMAMVWAAQGRPRPTAEEMRNLIETRVREEVLYREALALGLDKDDTIVRRQLARKMEFLAEDVSKLEAPKAGELRAWYDGHKDRFARPPRASFRHLYFSPDRRGGTAARDAAAALERLAGQPIDASRGAGDPFMFQSYYGDRGFDVVAREFGPPFARALTAAKQGAWTGPIQSGYGWHLVFVESLTPERVPDFDEIEPDVKAAWMEDHREEVRARMYKDMRARYDVVLPAGGR